MRDRLCKTASRPGWIAEAGTVGFRALGRRQMFPGAAHRERAASAPNRSGRRACSCRAALQAFPMPDTNRTAENTGAPGARPVLRFEIHVCHCNLFLSRLFDQRPKQHGPCAGKPRQQSTTKSGQGGAHRAHSRDMLARRGWESESARISRYKVVAPSQHWPCQ